MTTAAAPLLSVQDLRTEVETPKGIGTPVDGVTFSIERGETLALVGESGSGKSLTALSILGLHPTPEARIVGGEVKFAGVDLLKLRPRELRKLRGARIGLVLQDPMTALNPLLTVGEQIAEPLRIHRKLRGKSIARRAVELLDYLRIGAPEKRLHSYPHQMSGGMRQRVVGAIALSCGPELLIADEPTTALDATVQAAFLDHLKEIQRRDQLAILFITHDFGVVAEVCDAVAVMYAGRIVERTSTVRIFTSPAHPYSDALLRSVPKVDRPVERLVAIPGSPPSITQLPMGCRFRPRCPLYQSLGQPAACREEDPALREVSDGQLAACHFAETLLSRGEDVT